MNPSDVLLVLFVAGFIAKLIALTHALDARGWFSRATAGLGGLVVDSNVAVKLIILGGFTILIWTKVLGGAISTWFWVAIFAALLIENIVFIYRYWRWREGPACPVELPRED